LGVIATVGSGVAAVDGRQDEQHAERGDTPPARQPLSGLAAGYILVGALVIGFVIGWLIDRRFDTAPWWTVGLTAAFIVAGLYQVVKEYSK
jgi:F0F1-type ATP synthase assembly protein I